MLCEKFSGEGKERVKVIGTLLVQVFETSFKQEQKKI
jgi:hypothetical protein